MSGCFQPGQAKIVLGPTPLVDIASLYILCERTLLNVLDRPGAENITVNERLTWGKTDQVPGWKKERLDKKRRKIGCNHSPRPGPRNRKSSKVTEYTECQAFSSVVRIVSLRPLTRKRVLPPFGSRGGHTHWVRGGGSGGEAWLNFINFLYVSSFGPLDCVP